MYQILLVIEHLAAITPSKSEKGGDCGGKSAGKAHD